MEQTEATRKKNEVFKAKALEKAREKFEAACEEHKAEIGDNNDAMRSAIAANAVMIDNLATEMKRMDNSPELIAVKEMHASIEKSVQQINLSLGETLRTIEGFHAETYKILNRIEDGHDTQLSTLKRITALEKEIGTLKKQLEPETPEVDVDLGIREVEPQRKRIGAYIMDFCRQYEGKIDVVYAMAGMPVEKELHLREFSADFVGVVLRLADAGTTSCTYPQDYAGTVGEMTKAPDFGDLVVFKDYVAFFAGVDEDGTRMLFGTNGKWNIEMQPEERYEQITELIGYVRVEEPVGWTPPDCLLPGFVV